LRTVRGEEAIHRPAQRETQHRGYQKIQAHQKQRVEIRPKGNQKPVGSDASPGGWLPALEQ
jgi:hypothetical protein